MTTAQTRFMQVVIYKWMLPMRQQANRHLQFYLFKQRKQLVVFLFYTSYLTTYSTTLITGQIRRIAVSLWGKRITKRLVEFSFNHDILEISCEKINRYSVKMMRRHGH